MLAQPLEKIIEEDIFDQEIISKSSKSSEEIGGKHDYKSMELKYSRYLEEKLGEMLAKVREGNLMEISQLMKEQPCVNDESELEQLLKMKDSYLLNQVGDCGRNSLHWAIHMNLADVVSFLLIKGANPSVLTIDQYTPLQLAVVHHSF